MTPIRIRLVALATLTLLASACGEDPTGPVPVAVLEFSVDSSAGPLIRVANVKLDRPAAIEITYGASDTPVLTMPANSQSTAHRVVLPRLHAARDYDLQVTVLGDATPILRAKFGTDPLPPELARIQLAVNGQPSLPVSLIEIAAADSAQDFTGLLIVEQGRIVGYVRVARALFGMTRRVNGDLVLLHDDLGLVAHRLDGSIGHRLPAAVVGVTAYGRIHHDVTATPSNTLLFIADDRQMVDTVLVTGESLWEWNPETGTVVKRWSAFDHLDFRTERGREGNRSVVNNWLHGNGIQYGPRGNVIMSLRNISQVISIAPGFGSVEWKLGGANPTLALPDADRFFGQHYVSEPTPNRLLVYDNGFARPGCTNPPAGCYSRAVEYSIDPVARTATQVWEYRPAPDIYAALVGSARRLPNGNTLVLFGMRTPDEGSTGPLTAVEVDNAGAVQWRITVTGPRRLYRVTNAGSLLGERPGVLAAP